MSNKPPALHPAVPQQPTTLFGQWNEPAIVCVAGDYGVGKSRDATLFDPLGWTFALKGSTKSAYQWAPPDVYDAITKLTVHVQSLPEVVAYVKMIADGKMDARTIRIDDLSVLVRSYVAWLDTQYSKSNAFGKWNALTAMAIEFRDACKRLPVHTLIGAHLAQPKTTVDHGFEKGGPDCGGRQAMSAIVPILDVLYRVSVDNTAWPWPAVYTCRNPDPDWHTKDRHSIVLDTAPMNLREIFWAAGMRAARFPGYEWMDTVADTVASELLTASDAGKNDLAFKQALLERTVRHLTGQNVHDGVAYWAAIDGFDRATLARRPTLLTRALTATTGTAAPGASLTLPPLVPLK